MQLLGGRVAHFAACAAPVTLKIEESAPGQI
jgi:hypothetical protein